MELWGTLQPVPEGKTAMGRHELQVSEWNLVGSTPPGVVENWIDDQNSRLDHRYLILRSEKVIFFILF